MALSDDDRHAVGAVAGGAAGTAAGAKLFHSYNKKKRAPADALRAESAKLEALGAKKKQQLDRITDRADRLRARSAGKVTKLPNLDKLVGLPPSEVQKRIHDLEDVSSSLNRHSRRSEQISNRLQKAIDLAYKPSKKGIRLKMRASDLDYARRLKNIHVAPAVIGGGLLAGAGVGLAGAQAYNKLKGKKKHSGAFHVATLVSLDDELQKIGSAAKALGALGAGLTALKGGLGEWDARAAENQALARVPEEQRAAARQFVHAARMHRLKRLAVNTAIAGGTGALVGHYGSKAALHLTDSVAKNFAENLKPASAHAAQVLSEGFGRGGEYIVRSGKESAKGVLGRLIFGKK